MERGLNLAFQFIQENPVSKYSGKYDDSVVIEEPEVITPRHGSETTMISTGLADGSRITVYWDLSYGPVLVNENSSGEPAIKRLSGVIRQRELTPFQQHRIAELGITHLRILRYQLEFAKDKSGNPKLIIIQTIQNGKDTTHGCSTWSTLIYNLDGVLLFEIGGLQELRNIPGWMNWFFTPDGSWIILWQPDSFQPLFYKISELEDRLKGDVHTGNHIRVDRLDWVPKISPYTVSNITYLDKLKVEDYQRYSPGIDGLGTSDTVDGNGYLRVCVNDTGGSYGYASLSTDDFSGKLGTEISRGHKSTDIPITDQCHFMIDLTHRRLIPNFE